MYIVRELELNFFKVLLPELDSKERYKYIPWYNLKTEALKPLHELRSGFEWPAACFDRLDLSDDAVNKALYDFYPTSLVSYQIKDESFEHIVN
jgi:hypothetical protein